MEQQSGNGLGVAALVCGILGIVGSFIPIVCYFTLVLAILGTAFSALGVICVLACAATAGTAGLLS